VGELPKGWIETNLENIVDILDAQRIPLNSAERETRISGKASNQLYPYYGATGQVGEVDDFIFDDSLILLGEDGVPFFDTFRDKAYKVTGKCWVNNHAHVVKAISSTADQEYILHFLNNFNYTGYVSGSTRLKLTQASMRAIPVLLPPLNEQRRIADRLDHLLTRIDKTKAHLDRIPPLLKRFRQSVLAAATSGKLTEDWRNINTKWTSAQIKDLCLIIFDGPFGSNLKSDDYTNSGTRVIRLENLGHLKFIGERATYISPDKYEDLRRHTLQKNDIIFSSFVDEEMRTCLFPDIEEISINKADCFCIRVNSEICNPEFLVLRLACHTTFLDIQNLVHGVTRPRINLKQLRQLLFDIPPLEEQAEIVRRVETLFAKADRIETQYKKARQEVDRLTPALLAKAFRGELVPQDAKDEPASVLLERINGEKKGREKREKGRSKKT
jgi:type I restriction enzyme, S subunit